MKEPARRAEKAELVMREVARWAKEAESIMGEMARRTEEREPVMGEMARWAEKAELVMREVARWVKEAEPVMREVARWAEEREFGMKRPAGWVEVIGGVKAVHTGHEERYGYEEILFFDEKTGFRFCSNYGSLKEANEAIEKMVAKGRRMLVGPKAPWRHPSGYGVIPNKDKNAVGVYYAD